MANPRLQILDDIVSTLEGITTASGYNNTVQKVVKGKIILREMMAVSKLSAFCSVKYAGQTNQIEGPFTASGSDMMQASSEYLIYASMDLCTNTTFLGFLDDIEAALAKRPDRNSIIGAQGEYKVMDSFVTQISEPDTSGEHDEVVDDSSEQHKFLACFIRFSVIYYYIPHYLSGGFTGGI
tara:strand:- start:418 stop:960 length:543 start_codon:yes stop_codon:yes gene_type:complete